ncbi:Transforming growth factor beta-1-induced transcript 1 protein [Saitoella coloradoensis]
MADNSTYMSKGQLEDYLASLRSQRAPRPTGGRPLPSSAGARQIAQKKEYGNMDDVIADLSTLTGTTLKISEKPRAMSGMNAPLPVNPAINAPPPAAEKPTHVSLRTTPLLRALQGGAGGVRGGPKPELPSKKPELRGGPRPLPGGPPVSGSPRIDPGPVPKPSVLSKPAAPVSVPQFTITPTEDDTRNRRTAPATGRTTIPKIEVDEEDIRMNVQGLDGNYSMRNGVPAITVFTDERPAVPSINVDSPPSVPAISVGGADEPFADVQPPKIAPHPASPPADSKSCAHCHGSTTSGRVITTRGLRFHPSCFTCSHCSTNLEFIAFHVHEGRLYCQLDFHELFSDRCAQCDTPIEDEIISALGKKYHPGHFFCAECGTSFDTDTPFIVRNDYPYCQGCFEKVTAERCERCHLPMTDRYLAALGKKFHEACFKCGTCGTRLEGGFHEDEGVAMCDGCFRRVIIARSERR